MTIANQIIHPLTCRYIRWYHLKTHTISHEWPKHSYSRLLLDEVHAVRYQRSKHFIMVYSFHKCIIIVNFFLLKGGPRILKLVTIANILNRNYQERYLLNHMYFFLGRLFQFLYFFYDYKTFFSGDRSFLNFLWLQALKILWFETRRNIFFIYNINSSWPMSLTPVNQEYFTGVH